MVGMACMASVVINYFQRYLKLFGIVFVFVNFLIYLFLLSR